jgi:WD40 repeat protein/serine/threonine protein kinase
MSAPSSDQYELLDRLAEEFAERHRCGEHPALQEYIDRHPELADDIRKLFPAMALVERAEDDRRAWGTAAEGAAPCLPRQIGDYRIVREVGRGGMGIVYEAEQVSLGRRVALKVLPRQVVQDGVALERFRREARSAAKLHHTNVVPVFDVGQDGEISYYAMQFITGQGLDLIINELSRLRGIGVPGARIAAAADLAEVGARPRTTTPPGGEITEITRSLLDGRFEVPPVTPSAGPDLQLGAARAATASAVLPGGTKLSTAESGHRHQYHRSVARIGQQAAAALAYAHARGVVHRDIKPSNLLLDAAGVVWVTDFGLAKGEDEGLTRTGDILGTLRYMAPERFRGEGDARADIYALGLTLYELLTLRPAFDSPDRLELIEQVKSRQPERPRSGDPWIPRDLETIVLKAIDKDPCRRYSTAEALGEDLRRFLADEPLLARPVGMLERGWRWCCRNPGLAGSLAGLALLLVVAAGLALLYAAQQTRFGQEQLAARTRVDGLAKALEAKKENLELSLLESNRRMAALHYARGQAACEKGEIGPGLVWMVQSWRAAVAARDPAWQHAARTNLAAWQRRFPRLEVILSHSSALSFGGQDDDRCVALSPDGKIVVTVCEDGAARLCSAATGKPFGPPLRQQGAVIAVAFSPNGTTLLTGSFDGTARLWDTATGRPLGPPMVHQSVVWAVAFSPDGRTVCTGGEDGTARLWDAATRQPLGERLPHHGPVKHVAFSPDGNTLLAGSNDFTARLWNTSTGRLISVLKHDLVTINAAAFSPNGKTVVTASGDRTARLWDAVTGDPVGSLMRHDASVKAAVFSPDGKLVLTGSQDGTGRLWDAATGQPLSLPLRHDGGVYVVAFSPDSKIALTGSDDRTARLWDTSTGQPIGLPLQHHGGVRAIAFSRSGKTVLTASMDGTARLWGVAAGQPAELTLPHDGRVWSAVFSHDGRWVLTGSMDKYARLWDVSTGQLLVAMPHEATVAKVILSPDGKTALTVTGIDARGEAQTARLWDTQTGGPLGPPLGSLGGVWDARFSPDGKAVVTASDDRSARLWDAATGQPMGPPMNHGGSVRMAVFSPGGNVILTGSTDGTARFWDAHSCQPLGPPLRHPGWVSDLACGADGKTAVTVSGSTAQLWDVAGARPIGLPMRHQAGIRDFGITPDGKIVMTASLDGTARLWRATTGQPLGGPLPHQGALNRVAFSPDGKLAITASEDWTARLWDVATGQPVGPPLRHRNGVYPVSFSPDGTTVLTGSLDHTVRLWPVGDLPDDRERVATWVESLTALAVDPTGSIRPLERDAWLERREEVKRRGGPPMAEPPG